jgi:hypothetical protein
MKSLLSLLRDGAEELQAWFLARSLRREHRESYETVEPEPLPMPLQLGGTISELRKRISESLGSDEAIDERDPTCKSDRASKRRFYMMEGRGPKCVNIIYRYWKDDGCVWSISVANASPYYTADLGALSLSVTVDSIRDMLGEPSKRHQYAPVIEMLLWETPDYGYRVDSYSSTYNDIAGYARRGDINAIEWYSRALAPAGYDGGISKYDEQSA